MNEQFVQKSEQMCERPTLYAPIPIFLAPQRLQQFDPINSNVYSSRKLQMSPGKQKEIGVCACACACVCVCVRVCVCVCVCVYENIIPLLSQVN